MPELPHIVDGSHVETVSTMSEEMDQYWRARYGFTEAQFLEMRNEPRHCWLRVHELDRQWLQGEPQRVLGARVQYTPLGDRGREWHYVPRLDGDGSGQLTFAAASIKLHDLYTDVNAVRWIWQLLYS